MDDPGVAEEVVINPLLSVSQSSLPTSASEDLASFDATTNDKVFNSLVSGLREDNTEATTFQSTTVVMDGRSDQTTSEDLPMVYYDSLVIPRKGDDGEGKGIKGSILSTSNDDYGLSLLAVIGVGFALCCVFAVLRFVYNRLVYHMFTSVEKRDL